MDIGQEGTNPLRLSRIDQNYQTHKNVRDRFEVYELMDPYTDLESLSFDLLDLSGEETIVDIGTGDGSLLRRLRLERGHKGPLIGVEPNTQQFETASLWQHVETPNRTPSHQYLAKTALAGMIHPEHHTVTLLEGEAEHIPLPDASADILYAMFMLYHVPYDRQPAAFAEFKRVLKPEGIMALTTSSRTNKYVHRRLEEDIAGYLDITQPALMNSQYTTEIATEDLPIFFKHVYVLDDPSLISIRTKKDVNIYLDSIRSLRDQFTPEPSVEELEEAIQAVVMPQIIGEIQRAGKVLDFASRTLFFCSDRPLTIPDERFIELEHAE